MFLHHLQSLRCPLCHSENLAIERLPADQLKTQQEIYNGFVWCRSCLHWFPVENGVLDFLTGSLVYSDSLNDFWNKNSQQMQTLGLKPQKDLQSPGDNTLQKNQQNHSDWFADNDETNYTDYANTPFWHSIDSIVIDSWKSAMPEHGSILEPGCGQGRFTKYLLDRPFRILAFDLSRKLLNEASKTYNNLRLLGDVKAEVSFMAADATSIPVADSVFDAVFLSGVLHHLPNPGVTCSEIARALTSCGIYFGTENNTSVFRGLFDLIQHIFPLWKEEAGPEALISQETLSSWLNPAGMNLESYTHVYIPPHLVNLFSDANARKLLDISDTIGQKLPLFKDNGGLITFISRKHNNYLEQEERINADENSTP